MILFLHFVRRDCYDNLIGWVLVSLLTVIAYAFFGKVDFLPFYAVLGALYYLFSLFQQTSVWGGVPPVHNAGLSRTYLQSIPISRTRIFWLCFARGLVSTIPLLVLLLLFPWFARTRLSQMTGFQCLTRISTVYISSVITSVFFLQLLTCRLSIFNDQIRRTTGKWSRFLKYVQHTVIDTVLGIMAAVAPVVCLFLMAAQSPKRGITTTLLIASLVFNLIQMKRSYNQWMWE